MTDEPIDAARRATTLGLGLSALAFAAPPIVHAQNSAGDAADLLRDFLRLRTAPGGEAVMWRYAGILVGKPEGEMARPLTRIEGVSYTQAAPRTDGSVDWQLEEVGYYCDLENGRPLDRFANPFTQATVRVAHYRSPQKLRFIGNRIEPAQAMPPGVEFRGEIRRLAAVAGRVAVTEDLYVRMPAVPATETRPARAVRYANSLATFHGAERDLSKPARVWLPCEFSYTTLNSFASWLEMDGVAGVQDMRITGAKCRVDQRETIPAWLRERIALDHPGFLR